MVVVVDGSRVGGFEEEGPPVGVTVGRGEVGEVVVRREGLLVVGSRVGWFEEDGRQVGATVGAALLG